MTWQRSSGCVLVFGAVLALGLVVCANGGPRPSQPGQPRPATADAGADGAAVVPEPVRELETAVNAFLAAPGDPSHARLVTSLHALARAMRELAEARPAADSVDAGATRLQRSEAQSLEHADTVREAMASSLRGLTQAKVPEDVTAAYEQQLAALGRAVQAIRPKQPLLEQRESVAAALRAASNAVFLASGLGPVYPGTPGQPQPAQPRSFAAQLADARQDVAALGRADWQKANQAAGQALFAFAGLLQTAPGGAAERDRNAAVLRLQARRLTQADQPGFGPPGWVKQGLQAALDGLLGLPAASQPALGPWLQAARGAVAAVDAEKPLTFQRAPVQDAFRTIVDAFTAVEQERSADRGARPPERSARR
jgi:hypothetical protein